MIGKNGNQVQGCRRELKAREVREIKVIVVIDPISPSANLVFNFAKAELHFLRYFQLNNASLLNSSVNIQC